MGIISNDHSLVKKKSLKKTTSALNKLADTNRNELTTQKKSLHMTAMAVLTPMAGSLCVQLTATFGFQSVSPSS